LARFEFTKATKKERKARIALIGPSGSGKTYTALAIGSGLGNKVAVIDTENGTSKLYSDDFDFFHVDLDTFAPQTYVEVIKVAEEQGFDVIIIDSLSHAWMGKDGALEQVDKASKRYQGSTFAAWRDVTPHHNALVDAFVRCKAHLIVTMRAKTDYVVEKNKEGKNTVRKVGLAPIQREGLEYEFDIVGDMDLDNNFIVTKTRFKDLNGAVINKPGKELALSIKKWLSDGAPEEVQQHEQKAESLFSQGGLPQPAPTKPAPKRELTPHEQALASFHATMADFLEKEEDRLNLLKLSYAAYLKKRGKPVVISDDVAKIPTPYINACTRAYGDKQVEEVVNGLDSLRKEFEDVK
jgi:hypothetical protein